MAKIPSLLLGSTPIATSTAFEDMLDSCDEVFVKKLSNNDRDWSHPHPPGKKGGKHQGGIYIPVKERDSGFFPSLIVKERENPAADEIREAYFQTVWVEFGEIKESRLVNYTSKGNETHLTRVPKEAFSTLSPASFLLIGRRASGDEVEFQCLTIDSNSDEVDHLIDLFEIEADFLVDIFDLAKLRQARSAAILTFVDEAWLAWQKGEFAAFAAQWNKLPEPSWFALEAMRAYLAGNGLDSLDPWKMTAPGDALREISRTVELEIYRTFERKMLAVKIVGTIMGNSPKGQTIESVFRGLVGSVGEIDKVLMSATQARRSRAGTSFEIHIDRMLSDGNIPHQAQSLHSKKGRIDFLLPSDAYRKAFKPPAPPPIVLSAKTTIRERWKQVIPEQTAGDVFLATVDDAVAGNVIEELKNASIKLVVPEALKNQPKTKTTVYGGYDNVITFQEFFESEVGKRSALWKLP